MDYDTQFTIVLVSIIAVVWCGVCFCMADPPDASITEPEPTQENVALV
jgi:hypothetical protein